MTNFDMNCEAFDAGLLDYLEGTPDATVRASVERHLRECVRCAGLLRDIENIRDGAAALPDLAPSHDLWAGIEARITAPIIPLVGRPERQGPFVPAWMGIAAAALIVSTAGVTYLVTVNSLRPDGGSEVAVRTPVSASPGTLAITPASMTAESDALYGKEVEMLQNIVKQRKTQLDPSTIAVIERNLEIIDAAIGQSRAALAKDPASRMLNQQLTHALDKKVELLRTAAMLPVST
jgi:hypothetical protein